MINILISYFNKIGNNALLFWNEMLWKSICLCKFNNNYTAYCNYYISNYSNIDEFTINIINKIIKYIAIEKLFDPMSTAIQVNWYTIISYKPQNAIIITIVKMNFS